MFETSTVLGIVLVSAVVTIALRFLPFGAHTFLRDNAYLRYLSQHMPLGVTLLLVAYTFKDIDFNTAPYGLPMIIATILCVGTYALSRHTLLAIAVGLGSHLIMVNMNML